MSDVTNEEWIWHKGVGRNKHGENINLCGRPGAATNIRKHVTCNKCRRKLHMKLLVDNTTQYYVRNILIEIGNSTVFLKKNCKPTSDRQNYTTNLNEAEIITQKDFKPFKSLSFIFYDKKIIDKNSHPEINIDILRNSKFPHTYASGLQLIK